MVIHMFFTCRFTTQIWKQALCKTTLMADLIPSFRRGIKSTKLLITLTPTEIEEGHLFPWIIWAVWIARNKKNFNNHQIQPQEALFQAITTAREWQLTHEKIVTGRTHRSSFPRVIIDPNRIICRIEAAWREDSRVAALI